MSLMQFQMGSGAWESEVVSGNADPDLKAKQEKLNEDIKELWGIVNQIEKILEDGIKIIPSKNSSEQENRKIFFNNIATKLESFVDPLRKKSFNIKTTADDSGKKLVANYSKWTKKENYIREKFRENVNDLHVRAEDYYIKFYPKK